MFWNKPKTIEPVAQPRNFEEKFTAVMQSNLSAEEREEQLRSMYGVD